MAQHCKNIPGNIPHYPCVIPGDSSPYGLFIFPKKNGIRRCRFFHALVIVWPTFLHRLHLPAQN